MSYTVKVSGSISSREMNTTLQPDILCCATLDGIQLVLKFSIGLRVKEILNMFFFVTLVLYFFVFSQMHLTDFLRIYFMHQ